VKLNPHMTKKRGVNRRSGADMCASLYHPLSSAVRDGTYAKIDA
jgi:hypothetical protein